MSHRYNPYRRWLVIILLALLAPVVPGKMNLCLLPDGEMHLEVECSTPCSLAISQTVTAVAGQIDSLSRFNDGKGACRDFTVGESATRQPGHRTPQLTAMGLLIQPITIGIFPAGQHRAYAKPPAPSPHLKTHQTTVLRI